MKHGSVSPQQTPATSSWSHSPHPPHLGSPYEGPRDPGLHSGRTPGRTLHQTSDGWAAGCRALESDQGRCPSASTSHRANVGSAQALSGSAPVDSFIPISGRQQDPAGIHPTPMPRYTRLWTQQVGSPIPGPRGGLSQASVLLPLPHLYSVSGVGLLPSRLRAWVNLCPAGFLESVHTHGELRAHPVALHHWSQPPPPPPSASSTSRRALDLVPTRLCCLLG